MKHFLIALTFALVNSASLAESPKPTTPYEMMVHAGQRVEWGKYSLQLDARLGDTQRRAGVPITVDIAGSLERARREIKEHYDALKAVATTDEQRRLLMEWRAEYEQAFNAASTDSLSSEADDRSMKLTRMLRMAFE